MRKALFFICISTIICTSCQLFNTKDVTPSVTEKNTKDATPSITEKDNIYLYVDELMHSLYLWVDEVPNVNWRDYTDPDAMMQDMIYTRYDRWSAVYQKSKLDQIFSGEEYGFGFFLGWDNDDLRVMMVYKNSDAYKAGIRRGSIIHKIDNKDVELIMDWSFLDGSSPSSKTFSFETNGTSYEKEITTSTVSADQILHYQTYQVGGKKTGYIAYESFTSITVDSVIAVMGKFKDENVTELIVDLRYNGGGEVDVLTKWADVLVAQTNTDKAFFRFSHNKYYAKEYDSVTYLNPQPKSLELNQIFIIGSKNTASASEAMIKCLEPYMDVHVIGTTTHGKPVGMYVFEFENWYLLPMAFEYTNAYNEGGFYYGIEPECWVTDDRTKDWGDKSEACLAQALHYIEYGSYSSTMYAFSPLKSDTEPIVPFKQLGLISRMK